MYSDFSEIIDRF